MLFGDGRRRSRGVTLILVAAVLAVLAAMATGFYTISLMQTKSAAHYADSVRAQMVCAAGIHYATAQLRQQSFLKAEDPTDPWYCVDYLHGKTKGISFPAGSNPNASGGNAAAAGAGNPKFSYSVALGNTAGPNSDRVTLEVTDAASKINVNAGDNLAVILDNLCRLIGPPLVGANQDMLQPNRWAVEGADIALFGKNGKNDKANKRDIYYQLVDGRPVCNFETGTAIYGDGYAIAGYRARFGHFNNLEDVRNALTYVERNANNTPDDPLEQLEIEVKFAALRPYITINSWVDTNTVCVGKFEWVSVDSAASATIAIDRDKSWVSSVDAKGKPIPDTLNERGTLRGSYVSIVNGAGAGQLRRIKENGIDWIQVDNGFEVLPGPISSYMIMAKEDALTETIATPEGKMDLPKTDPDTGVLIDDPNINYQLRPLCIHRAPVNINTASDKVLAALFMGLNVQHGHPMAIATDADKRLIVQTPLPDLPGRPTDWKTKDPNRQEAYLLTLNGLKRIPASSGKLVLDRIWTDNTKINHVTPPPAVYDVSYINNYDTLGAPSFLVLLADPQRKLVSTLNEAHELAFRIIMARQSDPAQTSLKYIDPDTGSPTKKVTGLLRGPFKSWDDFYFRVVKPWDEARLDPAKNPDAPKKISVARMIMANFNSNTDILKFNPNIEWIDRWGRNFTEMEPVMVFDPGQASPKWVPGGTGAKDGMWDSTAWIADNTIPKGAYYIRSMRYKSEELIDKTDLNRSTTEFIFDSGGIYEIEAIGQVSKRGEVLAERKVRALVKVYDVWRESTQAQFVQGRIYPGPGAPPLQKGTPYSGQVARDSNPTNNGTTRLPLVTWPEPLVPLKYMIKNPNGLTDVVSGTTQYDAFFRAKTVGQPDVLANRVLPAQYDGQIALATNTSSFTDGPTDGANEGVSFLASFNGDLDTDTSNGNGREQAKTPSDKRVRVLDTIGLLGRLNDKLVDFDPMDMSKDNKYATFPVSVVNGVYKPLNAANYWENVTCRMGDLRSEGVWAGAVGVSGRDGTFKYLLDGTAGSHKNYQPTAAPGGNIICTWFKPAWQSTDHREHGFFNASNAGHQAGARYCELLKGGRFTWVEPDNQDSQYNNSAGTNGYSDGDLYAGIEDRGDSDVQFHLHGGAVRVPSTVRESPAFHVQPFRWSFVGCRQQWGYKDSTSANGASGYWVGQKASGMLDTSNVDGVKRVRPFIDTARDPEGTDWDKAGTQGPEYYWNNNHGQLQVPDIGDGGNNSYTQEAAWFWEDRDPSYGPANNPNENGLHSIFGANNLNKWGPESPYGSYMWLYRACPIDGTYAVLDEYKIVTCKTLWTSARIKKEMTLSRYYLPNNPSDPTQSPQFISQSLLSSLRGAAKAKHIESVALARLSWSVFTPRFLWEYQDQKGTRKEIVFMAPKQVKFRGPFDFVQYNYWILPSIKGGSDTIQYEPDINNEVPVLGVKRPSPADYQAAGFQPYSGHAVEIELLNQFDPDAKTRPLPGKLSGPPKTYTDPEAANIISEDLTQPVMVPAQNLHYRVRFRYPIDPLVAKQYQETATSVDPAKHCLLDTPVFDDISIVYVIAPRFLTYTEVTE